MALKIDWSSLDRLGGGYPIPGDGFLVNDYGHPSIVRYVQGNRVLTLTYDYVDETSERGRRFLIFKNYGIWLRIPSSLNWDQGHPLEATESATVLYRICRALEQRKRRPCRVVVDDDLYEKLAAIKRWGANPPPIPGS